MEGGRRGGGGGEEEEEERRRRRRVTAWESGARVQGSRGRGARRGRGRVREWWRGEGGARSAHVLCSPS
eukprot:3508821-Rhodomonas_salina.1